VSFKINFACGKQTWDDFYCVDAQLDHRATRDLDLYHAFTFTGETLDNPLPLEDNCADEVHAYHFIEHVYRWEADAVLREFKRLLKPGGLLILECPDAEKCCRNILNGLKENMGYWGLYGDPTKVDPFMCHRWAYTPKTLGALLKSVGYKNIRQARPVSHGPKLKRDMRMEANK
jgi:predicted SAM-dependent methyltransferase